MIGKIRSIGSKPKESTPEAPPELSVLLRVTLKDGRWSEFNRPYDSTKNPQAHWSKFFEWFNADVSAKSYPFGWSNSPTEFGIRYFVRTQISTIEIVVRPKKLESTT